MPIAKEKSAENPILQGLDFFIEDRSGIWVKQWKSGGGCCPATDEEVVMWNLLVKLTDQ
ncbi:MULTISPECIES: hypothetical protein [Enterobacterales]|uniref:hypothetical protein n=1 Tax=Enterobacterales TaxID=91347 RepID=UPI00313E27BE